MPIPVIPDAVRRQLVRDFLLRAAPAELLRERRISREARDPARVEWVQEIIKGRVEELAGELAEMIVKGFSFKDIAIQRVLGELKAFTREG